MNETLAWALDRARKHTLTLVADVPPDDMSLQSHPDEKHPAWILGHLLLADTYLLSLLEAQPLADDFEALLERYGPTSVPSTHPPYETKDELAGRLIRANTLRLAHVREMTDRDVSRPMPDELLVQAQPTLGHHLHSLVFHEGYHGGQLSAWRKNHGLTATPWAFGPGWSDSGGE